MNPLLLAVVPTTLKFIKYNIDRAFRKKVKPVPGSVLYSDLHIIVEHSGISLGAREISDIVVDKDEFAVASVKISSPAEFSDGGVLHKQIYVSSDSSGAVGNSIVAEFARASVGRRSFYGLVISNCHQFSERCVEQAEVTDKEVLAKISNLVNRVWTLEETWEPTIRSLKRAARRHLGAKKWLLWDLEREDSTDVYDVDVSKLIDGVRSGILNDQVAEEISETLLDLADYQEEISDENIPDQATSDLREFQKVIVEVQEKYVECKSFIDQLGSDVSFNDLVALGNENFTALAEEMVENEGILQLVRMLGRAYISHEKKESFIRKARTDVHGIHKSSDINRLLPSELVNFENEELEYQFFARLAENNLLTYELSGSEADLKEQEVRHKGPIVACLDTSGSMSGYRLLKARALLFSIARILKSEKRDLFIILFGSSGELKELKFTSSSPISMLINFISQGFNGGTDFKSPLKRSIEIVEREDTFDNADILMITDGYCSLSSSYKKKVERDKERLGFNIYTVLCSSGADGQDGFSDKVINI
jgi:uncharacterized protein with von Willebrand factor type A (vWA) domain